MTRDAIDSWVKRAEGKHASSDVRDIARILIEASTRADLLTDNSKDVFEANQRPRPDSLKELCNLLDAALVGLAAKEKTVTIV
jgi:hypothetical protein